jgi:hypothetical protein
MAELLRHVGRKLEEEYGADATEDDPKVASNTPSASASSTERKPQVMEMITTMNLPWYLNPPSAKFS